MPWKEPTKQSNIVEAHKSVYTLLDIGFGTSTEGNTNANPTANQYEKGEWLNVGLRLAQTCMICMHKNSKLENSQLAYILRMS